MKPMGTLPAYLQHAFAAACPPGWSAAAEVALLSDDLAALLGYRPQADLVLTHQTGRRIWIEFEISRADPVANHAKFGTAHLFQPQASSDSFLAMVSSHVDRGRRNLAATAVSLLRQIGMAAFQTTLLPHQTPATIRQLNHTPLPTLLAAALPVADEIERVFAVTEPVVTDGVGQIHFAGDLLDALLNLRRWGHEMEDATTRARWGRRVVTYFVADPRSGLFAPSKFCAYVDVTASTPGAAMTVARYLSLDGAEPRFDGHRARVHLTRHLAFVEQPLAAFPSLRLAFERWYEAHEDVIALHPRGPILLVPPLWF
jgi:hypothetical protein